MSGYELLLSGAVPRSTELGGVALPTSGDLGGLVLVGSFDPVLMHPFHTLALLLAVSRIFVLMKARNLYATEELVIGFFPWVAVAAALSVFGQVVVLPEQVIPFLSSPLVYLTAFAIGGHLWLHLAAPDRRSSREAAESVALSGILFLAPIAGATIALSGREVHPLWSLVAVLVAVSLSILIWAYVDQFHPGVTGNAGLLGFAVLLGHLLDASTTLIGIDIFGLAEQTPLSRDIMEFAATLPTADLLGMAWLFVVVKVLIALGIVYVFSHAITDARHRSIVLGIAATTGFGPALHNLFLYTIL
ncbi:DUF63 family protein [Haloarchaeobius amylolyticus]|uniref:DUF63 family protein n=1 Tax=Haloarchaeobius amylolyticus TaxID=1198296 RepID=UPI002270A58C|nr:DUF63 family protein [Haloarchaeobius amylolyticus]